VTAAVSLPDQVDAPSAVEFMREALVKISEEDIGTVAELLVKKRALLAPALERGSLERGTADAVRPILEVVFSTRRRTDQLLVSNGAPVVAAAIGDLLHGPGTIDARFRHSGRKHHVTEPERLQRRTERHGRRRRR